MSDEVTPSEFDDLTDNPLSQQNIGIGELPETPTEPEPDPDPEPETASKAKSKK